MDKMTSKVGNMKRYLMVTPFKAPIDRNNYSKYSNLTTVIRFAR